MNRFLSTAKLILLLVLITASFAAVTPGQDGKTADVNNLRNELINQDIRMHDELPRGFTTPYRNWTNDYIEITEAGEILSKAEVLARYKASANRRPNIAPENHVIHFHQDTIIMTHVLKRNGLKDDKDGYRVIPTVYSFVITHVFIKRNGRWQMSLTQSTPVVLQDIK